MGGSTVLGPPPLPAGDGEAPVHVRQGGGGDEADRGELLGPQERLLQGRHEDGHRRCVVHQSTSGFKKFLIVPHVVQLRRTRKRAGGPLRPADDRRDARGRPPDGRVPLPLRRGEERVAAAAAAGTRGSVGRVWNFSVTLSAPCMERLIIFAGCHTGLCPGGHGRRGVRDVRPPTTDLPDRRLT